MQELTDIYESIESDESYEAGYRRLLRKYPFLQELLNDGYDELCSHIKLHSEKHEFLRYDRAAETLDKVVLSLMTVFDQYLGALSRANGTPASHSDTSED